MEQKGKLYQQDIKPKETYEKPQIFSEEVEIGVYGQGYGGPLVTVPGPSIVGFCFC